VEKLTLGNPLFGKPGHIISILEFVAYFLQAIVQPLTPVVVALSIFKMLNPMGELHQWASRGGILDMNRLRCFTLNPADERRGCGSSHESDLLVREPVRDRNEHLIVTQLA
jgi:hypothetical protein